MAAHNLAHDGEPEAAAWRVLATLAEAVEHKALHVRRDASPLVSHLHHDVLFVVPGRYAR